MYMYVHMYKVLQKSEAGHLAETMISHLVKALI